MNSPPGQEKSLENYLHQEITKRRKKIRPGRGLSSPASGGEQRSSICSLARHRGATRHDSGPQRWLGFPGQRIPKPMGNKEGSAMKTASSGAGVWKLISGPVYVNLVPLKTKSVGSFQGPHGPGLMHLFHKGRGKGGKERLGVMRA